MDRVFQDAKYALRVLLRDRGFTTTAVLTLAICIGANAAIFAIVNSVLLQPLPVPHAEQLVHMYNAYPGAGLDDDAGATGVVDYYDRLRETTVFQEQALYNPRGVTIGQDGSPQRITAMGGTPSLLRLLQVQLISPFSTRVSPGFFEAMRIPLVRGRLFRASDDARAPKVTVIDERLAARFFGDKDPIGRRLWQADDATELARGPGKIPSSSTRPVALLQLIERHDPPLERLHDRL